jgi:hypothetical protein
LETLDIKEEPLQQINKTMSSCESNKLGEFLMVQERFNSSSFATFSEKNEVFQPEIVLRPTSQSGVLPSKPTDTENEVFQSEMEKEIVKLFGEFDMMTLYDYDQTRVRKVKQLVEKYQRITQEVIVKLYEDTLEVKTNELIKIKEELQMAESTNLTLSKRIEEMERNQVSGQKKSLKPDLNLNSEPKSRPEKKKLPVSKYKEKNLVIDNETLEQSDNQSELIVENQIEAITTNVTNSEIVEKSAKNSNFNCPTCGSINKTAFGLRQHISTVHMRKKTFSCADCTKCYAHAKTLKTHIELVHKNKTYTCSQCGKALRSAHNLSAHVQNVHEKQKKFICEFCTKAFGRNHDLKFHVARLHKRHIN